jgi:glycosyltransferase involved in cell wall biosynthesis
MISISVVIPTYKRAAIIENTIKSCLKQQLLPAEIIVVDDASDDDTEQVLQSIKHDKVDIRFIQMPVNGGAQKARNEGVKQAKYDWIAFLDSDDEWLPDKLHCQVKALQQMDFNPYVVVHGNCITRNHKTNTDNLWNLPIVSGERPYKTLLKAPSPVFPSILTSKKALFEVGLLDEKVPSYQEWDTALKLSTICYFIHLEQPLFIYHLHKGETISKNNKRAILGYHYILTKYRQDIIENYGNEFFVNCVMGNIKQVVTYQEWELGVKLLKEVKKVIPLKAFLFYSTCFRFHINPDKLRNAVSAAF